MRFSIVVLILFSTLSARLNGQLTPLQKYRCEQFTSIFENDTTELQYDYVENIYDGRGYTAGRAGFTTGTGDAVQVVRMYTQLKPRNPLAKFLPKLEQLAQQWSGDVSSLNGYPQAWREASQDVLFRQVQDAINDHLHYFPAMNEAKKLNLTNVLGICAFYDTIIQHGGGVDSDSLGAIIRKTEKAMNGRPPAIDEYWWTWKFLEIRKQVLQQAKWRGLIDRANVLADMALTGNWDMIPPMHVKTKHHDKTIQ